MIIKDQFDNPQFFISHVPSPLKNSWEKLKGQKICFAHFNTNDMIYII